MKRLTLVAVVCLAICSCINDDEIITSATALAPADQLYLTVRLNDSSAATRATAGDFEYGTEAEYAVTDGRFYFYDKDGVFVSRASVWTEGQATTQDDTATSVGSVEYTSGTVIVLKGLTGKNNPKYMVTVLNEPEGFEDSNYMPTQGATLGELVTMLASESTTGIYDDNSNFVMSTSSYLDSSTTTSSSRTINDNTYFVTELSEENFAVEPVASELLQDNGEEAKPVQVYVDRLAVKVTVEDQSTSSGDTDIITATYNGDTVYCHLASDVTLTGDGESTTETSETLYIALLGCNLNATARKSYMFKQLDSTWTDDNLWSNWNDDTNHRSYWGKGYAYGISNFPESNSQKNTADDEAGNGTTNKPLNDYLEYHDLTDDNLAKFTYDETDNVGTTEAMYCAENTNSVTTLTASLDSGDEGDEAFLPSAVTAVLVKAVVGKVDTASEEVEGNATSTFTPVPFITYQGGYYTPEAFIDAVGGSLGLTDYYYSTDDSDYSSIPFSALITFSNVGDGYVTVTAQESITIDGITGDVKYYTKSGEEYTAVDDGEKTILEAVSSAISSWQAAHTGEKYNYYNEGLMYYSIPLEHINSSNEGTLVEGQYGVVRNHHYNLVLTSVSNLGKGIYDDTEVIVPNENEDTNLYISATTELLPWKVYEQHVVVN